MTSKWSLKWFLVLVVELALGIWFGFSRFGSYFPIAILIMTGIVAVSGAIIVVAMTPIARQNFMRAVRSPYAESREAPSPRQNFMRAPWVQVLRRVDMGNDEEAWVDQ